MELYDTRCMNARGTAIVETLCAEVSVYKVTMTSTDQPLPEL